MVAPSDILVNYSYYSKKELDEVLELTSKFTGFLRYMEGAEKQNLIILVLKMIAHFYGVDLNDKKEHDKFFKKAFLIGLDNMQEFVYKFHFKKVVNDFQKFVHVMNNKFRVSGQSPFSNVSIFDRPNLEKLFGEIIYPDGSSVDIDYVSEVQEAVAEWFSKGDPSSNLPYRFPVMTANMSVNEDREPLDEDFLKFVARTNTDKGVYNIYGNEGSKIAMCCLPPTTKVLTRVDDKVKYITVKQLYDIWNRNGKEKHIEIMGDKGFVTVKNGIELLNNSDTLLKIILSSGLSITTTLDHPSVIYLPDGTLKEVKAGDISVGDMLPVSKDISYETNIGNSRELGRFVGLFGAEGGIDDRRDNEIRFTFNSGEKELIQFVSDYAADTFGAEVRVDKDPRWDATTVVILSRSCFGLMDDMFINKSATTKRLKSRPFNCGREFRLGFIEGFIEGDGYTADNTRSDYGSIHIGNKELAKDLVALMNTVNVKASFHKDTTGWTVSIYGLSKKLLTPISDWTGGNGNLNGKLKDFGGLYGVKVTSIYKIKTKKDSYVYDFEVDSDEHLFQIANGIVTHNCRFVNDLERMEYRADSFGNGGLNIGSHRVVTINLPKIALEADRSFPKYFEILEDRLCLIRDILLVHREEILQRRVDRGFLKFFKPLGWMDLDMFFSTIGIIGVYEACYYMGIPMETPAGQMFAAQVLEYIDNYAKKFSKETGHSFNTEEIPGESAAVTLAKKDRVKYGDSQVFELYSNQYLPLISDISLIDRIKVSGKLMNLVSGGGIVHANIASKIDRPEKMEKTIRQTLKAGVPHFAVSYSYGICENEHTSVVGNSNICPICGGKILDHYTRVIGYWTKTSSWNEVRREYEFPNRKYA